MNDITNVQGESGIVLNGATPTPSPKKVKRIKHESKINIEFMEAIESLKTIYNIKKTSKVIEMIFEKKTFSRNVADKTLNDIRAKLNGFQTQAFQIYDYCITRSESDNEILQKQSVKKYYDLVKATSDNDAKVTFFRQFKAIQKQMTFILTKSTVVSQDDSKEIISIIATFNSAIDDNLPARRNLAFRLNQPTDMKYFPADKPKIGDGEFRRIIHHAMMNNCEFIIEKTSSEAINHVRDAMVAFHAELKKYQLKKAKEEPIDIHRFFMVVLTLKKALDKFQIN